MSVLWCESSSHESLDASHEVLMLKPYLFLQTQISVTFGCEKERDRDSSIIRSVLHRSDLLESKSSKSKRCFIFAQLLLAPINQVDQFRQLKQILSF